MPYEWPETMTYERREMMRTIARTVQLNGPYVELEGRAMRLLVADLAKQGIEFSGGYLSKSFAELCGQMDGAGPLLRRKVTGKRTFEIHYIGAADAVDTSIGLNGTGDDEIEETEEEAGTEEELEEIEGHAVEITVEDLEPDFDIDEARAVSAALVVTEPDGVPEASEVDVLCYVISALQDVITRLNGRGANDFERYLTGRVDMVDRQQQEINALRVQLEQERTKVRGLTTALQNRRMAQTHSS